MTKLALPLIFAFVVAGIVFMALVSPARHSSGKQPTSCSSSSAVSMANTSVRTNGSASRSKHVTDSDSDSYSEITPLNDAAFEHEVLDSKGVVLVDFAAIWCGPCKMMAPVVQQLDIAWHGKVKVLKLDVDESPVSADRYGVRVLPTFIIFKDGKAVERITGVTSFQNLNAIVQKYL
jgi:thioredoxin 1